MPELKKIINNISNVSLFFAYRSAAIIIGALIGYHIITKYLSPVMDDLCLTNTQNCQTIRVYRDKNTFIAKDEVSQIWFWYNGTNLYVYGQTPGVCQSQNPSEKIEPVNVMQMKADPVKNVIRFAVLPNQCINGVQSVIDYYQNVLGVKEETFILKRQNPSATTNIYNIVQSMYENDIFKF